MVGQCVLDIDRRVLTVDDAFLGLLGRSLDEVVGKTEAEFTHREDRRLSDDLINKLDNDGASLAITKRYVRADDAVVWVTNHVSLNSNEIVGKELHITSSLCDPGTSHPVAANWQIAKSLIAGFEAGKTAFGPELFCATPVEAMLLLYTAESDGRSLTIADLSEQARLAIPVMERWVTALADRGLIEIVKYSATPESTVLRIGQNCHRQIDDLILASSPATHGIL